MQNRLESGPHEAYLDAVFARIDRIRHIDVSVLTQRYGIDPAVLSAVDREAESSWAVRRVLSDADAQREELREHLDGLTREYIAEGLGNEAAVLKAQETLGDSGMLAADIGRATSQAVLALNSRQLLVLRSVGSARWFGLPIAFAVYSTVSCQVPFEHVAAYTIFFAGLAGWLRGFMLGCILTPRVWQLLNDTTRGIQSLRNLPSVRQLTRRQRINRIILWWSWKQLIETKTSSSQVKNPAHADVMTEVLGQLFMVAVSLGVTVIFVWVARSVLDVDGIGALLFCYVGWLGLGNELGCAAAASRRIRRQSRAV